VHIIKGENVPVRADYINEYKAVKVREKFDG